MTTDTAQTTGTDHATTAGRQSTTPPTAHPARRRGGPGRVLAMVRGELRLLLRNKTATFYAVAMAPLMVAMFAALPTAEMISASMGAGGFTTFLVLVLALMGLTMAIYYILTSTVVARREKLVLKRLVSGESSPREVLTAVATPAVGIFLLQFALVLTVACVAFGAPVFTNPLLIVVGLALGIAVAVLLSFLTGTRTATVEAAQMTTMPGMLVGFFASGVVLPAAILPDAAARVLDFLPVKPVMDLISLGLTGTTLAGESHTFAQTFTAAAQPVVVMIVWIAIMTWLLRRTMRWEPRR